MPLRFSLTFYLVTLFALINNQSTEVLSSRILSMHSIASFNKHYSNEIAHTIRVVNYNTMCQWKKNKYYIHEISPLFPVTLKLIKLIMKKPH
jgi:hypothetical protein